MKRLLKLGLLITFIFAGWLGANILKLFGGDHSARIYNLDTTARADAPAPGGGGGGGGTAGTVAGSGGTGGSCTASTGGTGSAGGGI